MPFGAFNNKKITTPDGKRVDAAGRMQDKVEAKRDAANKNKERAAGNISGSLGRNKESVKQDIAAAPKQQGMAQALLNAQTPTKLLKGPQETVGDLQGARDAATGMAGEAPKIHRTDLERVGLNNRDKFAGATIDTAQQNQFRADQRSLTTDLMNKAKGEGTFAADVAAQQGAQAGLAAQIAAANAARGGPSAATARGAMQAGADIQAQVAQDAMQARIQEQMQAAGMAGQMAEGARAQDIGLAQAQAGLEQQAGITDQQLQSSENVALMQSQQGRANLQGQLAQQRNLANQQADMAQNDLMARYTAMGMDAQQAKAQAEKDWMGMQMQQVSSARGLAEQARSRKAQEGSQLSKEEQMLMGGLSGVTSMFSFGGK